MVRAHRITDWDPEDVHAWETGNKTIARRNLICTVAADHVAFSIWSLWSVMALFMPEDVYGFRAGDKLLLGAVAALVGGVVRIPYILGIARFGGRNWTMWAALLLLVPTAGTLVLLAHPGLPLWPYLVCAALTGFGGGNYAASLANVNAFYPQRLKGWALGLSAGGANLGVASVQLIGLLVIAAAGNRSPHWVCAIYLVLLALVGIAAALFMDNLDHSIEVAHLRSILSVPDSWVITFLYVCAFGSWIGFAFAFSQILEVNFVASGQSTSHAALHAAQIAFVGPLLGALSRIAGGKVSDRVGGGRVTLVVFAGMFLATGMLVGISTHEDSTPGAVSPVTLAGYIAGFLVLFVVAGVGNGSVFKLIPAVFDARSRSLDLNEADRRHWSRSMSAALIGFAATMGAVGGVVIDLVLRQSYATTGTETPALWIFLVSYSVAAVVTWRRYVRRPVSASTVPNPALLGTAPQPRDTSPKP
jgi:NNP family nitrate/nitrite transporter-like MFS transporter